MGCITIPAVYNCEILTEYWDWSLDCATQEKPPIFDLGVASLKGPIFRRKAAVPSNVDPGETPQPTWRDLWVRVSRNAGARRQGCALS